MCVYLDAVVPIVDYMYHVTRKFDTPKKKKKEKRTPTPTFFSFCFPREERNLFIVKLVNVFSYEKALYDHRCPSPPIRAGPLVKLLAILCG